MQQLSVIPAPEQAETNTASLLLFKEEYESYFSQLKIRVISGTDFDANADANRADIPRYSANFYPLHKMRIWLE
jgi:hypothetical protein